MMHAHGQPFAFPGLWSPASGNGDSDKRLTALFYAAVFADQTDGLFGSITVSTTMTRRG
jgi:hypothetical protein